MSVNNQIHIMMRNELQYVASIAADFKKYETLYFIECNKSSKDYEYAKANEYVRLALKQAKLMQEYCEEEGYELRSICFDCENFIDQYDKPQNY